MAVILIAAVDTNWGIAKEGTIPWSNAEDLKFFANTTKGSVHRDRRNAVIMGRGTYETLGKALPYRINYVISRTLYSKMTCLPDLKWYRYLSSAVHDAKLSHRDVFIIGGESIYKQALEANFVDKLVISKIPGDYKCDQFLEINNYNFKIMSTQNMGSFEVCTFE